MREGCSFRHPLEDVWERPEMKRLAILSVLLGLPLSLSGCGIPDLAAHAVKEVEKSRERGRAEVLPASAPAAQPQVWHGSSRAEPEPPPPPVMDTRGVPARETVTVESLPPQ